MCRTTCGRPDCGYEGCLLAAAGDAVSDEDLNILQERVVLGKQVLTIAVLSIIITAPVGAAAIMTAGPRLLKKARHTLTT